MLYLSVVFPFCCWTCHAMTCLFIRLWGDIWVVSGLGTYEGSCCDYLCTDFWVNRGVCFSGVNA